MQDYFYKVIIEPQEEGGFTAYIPSLRGCITEGDTYEETLHNMREALELYLETMKERRNNIRCDTVHISEIHVRL